MKRPEYTKRMRSLILKEEENIKYFSLELKTLHCNYFPRNSVGEYWPFFVYC